MWFCAKCKIKELWTLSTPWIKPLKENRKRSMTCDYIFNSLWSTGRIQTKGSLNDDVSYGCRNSPVHRSGQRWHHSKTEMETRVQHISWVNNRQSVHSSLRTVKLCGGNRFKMEYKSTQSPWGRALSYFVDIKLVYLSIYTEWSMNT
jgi:hypothetical protein